MEILRGVIPPLLTLFKENGDFDKENQKKLINFLIDSDVDGLFILGSVGEFTHLSPSERKEITEFCLSVVDGRVPVIVGTAGTSTAEVIELTLHAKQSGASGAMIINPYYWSLSDDNQIDHYESIAHTVGDFPLYLYNYSKRSGQNLNSFQVKKIVRRIPTIIGIKNTDSDPTTTKDMILHVKSEFPNFSVLVGAEETYLHLLNLGVDGVIPATANFAPHLSVGIKKSFFQGNYAEGLLLTKELSLLSQVYSVDETPIAALKEALYLTKNIRSFARKPAQILNESAKQEVKNILSEIESIKVND
jgi:2-dehydro-3-deoxy-D-pentonate aldolase